MAVEAQPVIAAPNPAPAAAPAAKESFTAAMERIAKTQGDTPEVTEAAEVTEAPAPRPKVVEVEQDADKDGKVTVAERAAWRETKRKQHEALQVREREAMERVSKREQEVAERIAKADAVVKAFEENDPNALAKALGAEDWNKLQESYISRLADPNYKELQSVKRKLEEREKSEQETAKQAEARAKAEFRQQKIREHVAGISSEMKTSKNQVLSTLHDDPWFVQNVFELQKEHWDGEATVTPEQALDLVPKGGTVTLRKQLETVRDRLTKALGAPPAAAAPAAPKAKPAPKSAPVPPSAAPSPSAPAKFAGNGRFHSDGDRVRNFRDRMSAAIDEDERSIRELQRRPA
jgi:hypothetical protein